MEQINRRLEAFFAWKDAEGVTNREKIARNQRVIRRVGRGCGLPRLVR